MLDPERHDLPEIVISLLACLEASMVSTGAPDPVLASRTLAGQILRHWGGIQAYIAAPESKLTPRFTEEARIWCAETVAATGASDELANAIASQVARDLRQHFAGQVLYLPKDKWSFRADLNREFNGHNQVDLCRRYGLTTSFLYRVVFDERNGPKSMKGNRTFSRC
jgi:Mor family transcriptional regulator